MPAKVDCPKCGRRMDEGFIIDTTSGTASVSTWHEGEPQKSIWTGVKKSKERYEVATWRCGRCGFLESYAE